MFWSVHLSLPLFSLYVINETITYKTKNEYGYK